MNRLQYKRSRGEEITPFDEANAHVPAEVFEDYEPPAPAPIIDIEAPQMMSSGQLAGIDEPPAPKPPPAPQPAPAPKPLLGDEDLRRLLAPPAQKPGPDLEAARALDRKRQQHDDLRNLLLQAATRGQSGQLRNLGNPETQLALSQQPKQQDELDRALKVAQLKKLFEPKEAKPFDADESALKRAQTAKILWDMQHPKAAEGAKGEDRELTPEERAVIEPTLRGKTLSPHATWREVHALQPPMQFDIATGEARRREQTANEERDQAKVERLAKEVGANPAKISAALDELDRAAEAKDIPGIGPVDALKPDVLSSDEAIHVRNQAKDMVNTLLFMQSGQGVSNQERENKYKLYGITGGSEQAFRDGMKRLRRDMAAELAAKQAGFDPKTVETFKARGGATPEKLNASGGKVLMRRGDDYQWVAPEDVEAARKDGYFTQKEAAQ